MRHQPQLWLPGPWSSTVLDVSTEQERHLSKVLRLESGAAITYTDGRGSRGTATWTGAGVDRGPETTEQRPVREVVLAVVPPKARDRQRMIVEKLQELGVAELVWVSSEHAEGRPPKPERSEAWITAALEQSRGAWRMSMRTASIDDLVAPIVADGAASVEPPAYRDRTPVTIAIGPEGGWSDREMAGFVDGVRLAPTVLRTETAAIVAASRFLA